jgi:hypothetical protein
MSHDEAVSHSALDDSFSVIRAKNTQRRGTGNGMEQATTKYGDSGFARMTSIVVVMRGKCRSRFLRCAAE